MLDPHQSAILRVFDIKMATFRLKLLGCWQGGCRARLTVALFRGKAGAKVCAPRGGVAGGAFATAGWVCRHGAMHRFCVSCLPANDRHHTLEHAHVSAPSPRHYF